MKHAPLPLIAAALAGIASLHAADPAPKKIQNAKVIFLGDSLTSNNGSLGEARGYYHWTDTVKKRFNLEVVNLGKGGSRADAGLERLTKAVVEEKQRPDFVLINFGMNDHKIAEKTKAAVSSPEAFEKQLTDIVELVKSIGATPILATPHAIYEGSKGDLKSYYGKYDPANFASYGGALAKFDTFMEVIRKVAAKENIALIDIRKESDKLDKSTYTIEGVHLNGVGHKLWADTIGNYLADHY